MATLGPTDSPDVELPGLPPGDLRVGIRPRSNMRGTIHKTYRAITVPVREMTLCGATAMLVPLKDRAEGDVPCKKCWRP